MPRAPSSGRRLTEDDASLVKGMIARGDRHHDVAAWFGVNQGRIAEVNDGELYPNAPTAAEDELPPPGPYSSGRTAHKAILALEAAKSALDVASKDIEKALKDVRKGG